MFSVVGRPGMFRQFDFQMKSLHAKGSKSTFVTSEEKKRSICSICLLPRNGTLTDAGDGVGGLGGQQITNNYKKSQKTVRTKIGHTSGHFSKNVKNIFQICSYIQKMTPNPINA